jgi:hypothetical protein
MIQICYSSQARKSFTPEQLTELLGKARTNNHALGVSGLLLYENGTFIQVLEGDPEKVAPLFDKIQRDYRHKQMLLIFKQEIEKRSFESWDMGFFHVDRKAVSQLPGYHNFFTKDFSAAAFRRDADRIREIFLQFRDGKWKRRVSAA